MAPPARARPGRVRPQQDPEPVWPQEMAEAPPYLGRVLARVLAQAARHEAPHERLPLPSVPRVGQVVALPLEARLARERVVRPEVEQRDALDRRGVADEPAVPRRPGE